MDDMLVDPECHSKSPSVPFPNPIEEPPLPPPPPLMQADQPMQNYRQPAWYIDINLEPLQPLNKEPPPPMSILPHIVLIVHNQLWTAANSFNLLREYLY